VAERQIVLPPATQEGNTMSNRKPFILQDWLVPPVIVPLGMAIVVLLAMLIP
jgi:hypothetical protein